MGKYNIMDSNLRSSFTDDAPFLEAIANELAEANRLKRIELQMKGGFIPINDKSVEQLEDQA